jgi:hypothetical protein
MDNVNIESTMNFITKIDKKIIEEMDNITFEYNGLSKEAEKLLQILNYSPKVIKPNREKIKNMKNIEMPQLSELQNLDFSKLDINAQKRNQNKEIKIMIKNLLMNIIDEIIKNINKRKASNKDSIDEDELNMNTSKINDQNINLNLMKYNSVEINYNKVKYIRELKVFLFNKDDFIIIDITPEDTINILKEKIINKIIAEKDYEIKYNSLDEYELKTIKVENDKYVVGLLPIPDTKFIYDNNLKIISFLENEIKKLKTSKL